MQFTPGALVKARGREWIVLPSGEAELLRLRPITTGSGGEIGLYTRLEEARPTAFADPDPDRIGDSSAVSILFDAARLSLRAGAAPFRSFGRISVVPRPYQFVPLIMALRLDPVRLLIADDVGVGKTIEAAMIAREMLDRGLAKRLAVLCPTHLCDQWEQELRQKFALQAAIVQPSRIARLERELPRPDLSLYGHYKHLVASIDYVKAERHREPFLRDAPDLVIIDEAHACARPRAETDRLQHQRYALLQKLAEDRSRHILLVTATPHSGIEESFRSLLGILDPLFDPPAGAALDREVLVPHIVQRRRKDVESWLGADTPFPERLAEERAYELSKDWLALYHEVLAYCRETIAGGTVLRAAQQRVRHWAAIALLRCLLSSPEAAATVLDKRASRSAGQQAQQASADDIDRTYRPQVLDALGDEQPGDYAPTAPFEDAEAAWSDAERQRLLRFRRRAMALAGSAADRKLAVLCGVIRELLRANHRPIVFCRFIPTAHYVSASLSRELAQECADLQVCAVTGEIGDDERREKIAELVKSDRHVLVATDCLSEGINLQDHFDAVVHYDLPWNPNRLEQREGRVDRFGQERKQVRTVLLYGSNNEVDQVVLDVLIRKWRTIRISLGVSVPIPAEAEQVVEAVVDNVLLRRSANGAQLDLAFTAPEVSRLHQQWDAAAERERRQRSYFSQHAIKPEEVACEIAATDGVLGDPDTVRRFLGKALQRFNGALKPAGKPGVFTLIAGDLGRRVAGLAGNGVPLRVTFDRHADQSATSLGRTHPLVELLCDAVIAEAFSPALSSRFARAGAMATDAVRERTVLLLLRLRYLLREQEDEFAEEVALVGFVRRDEQLCWLEPKGQAARHLADTAVPTANLPDSDKRRHVRWALQFLNSDRRWFEPLRDWRVAELQAAHTRLRKLTKAPKLVVEPRMPPDILGCFVLVPAGGQR